MLNVIHETMLLQQLLVDSPTFKRMSKSCLIFRGRKREHIKLDLTIGSSGCAVQMFAWSAMHTIIGGPEGIIFY